MGTRKIFTSESSALVRHSPALNCRALLMFPFRVLSVVLFVAMLALTATIPVEVPMLKSDAGAFQEIVHTTYTEPKTGPTYKQMLFAGPNSRDPITCKGKQKQISPLGCSGGTVWQV